MIKIIAGLGNPGPKYKETRHNLGFMIIDRLRCKYKVKDQSRECHSEIFAKTLKGERRFFLKPMTFMNLSGKALRCVIDKSGITPKELLVIFDDVDLPFGEIRIKDSGGSGGHNGMESIIEYLETEQFPRLRIGIKNDGVEDLVEFVLSQFLKKEQEQLEELIDYSADCVNTVLYESINNAQKQFNRKNLFEKFSENQEVTD